MIAFLLAVAQVVPAPDEPKPAQTSIAAIRANPKKFDGQLVRLQGYVNSCQKLSCAIDQRLASAPGGPGQRLSIATDPKFDTFVTPLLPTYVEFDARVEATCLTGAPCADRAPTLTVVSLRSVVSPEPPAIEN